jgi:hypothetical protein
MRLHSEIGTPCAVPVPEKGDPGVTPATLQGTMTTRWEQI